LHTQSGFDKVFTNLFNEQLPTNKRIERGIGRTRKRTTKARKESEKKISTFITFHYDFRGEKVVEWGRTE
jgi:hypothetical protein